jgi:hypothetical protein
VSRRGINEIVPGKLYQRGHMLTWPAADKHRMLDELGITVVVNLWLKVDPDLSGRVIYINWPISGAAVPPDADAMTAFVSGLLSSGHVVLVHCEAGKNRSVWFCARLLRMAFGPSARGTNVLDLVKRKVPGTSLRSQLERDVA